MIIGKDIKRTRSETVWFSVWLLLSCFTVFTHALLPDGPPGTKTTGSAFSVATNVVTLVPEGVSVQIKRLLPGDGDDKQPVFNSVIAIVRDSVLVLSATVMADLVDPVIAPVFTRSFFLSRSAGSRAPPAPLTR